jgi:DNA-binding MarR family transcriptional regulator
MNYSSNVLHAVGDLQAQALLLAKLTRDLSRCCQNKEEQIFGKFTLSSAEGRVLLVIAELGSTTPSELATKLALGRSRLTPLVDNLVEKDLVARAESADDRRMRKLELTVAGRQAAKEVMQYQTSFHEELLRRFSPEERQHLLQTLDELYTAIEELRGKLGDGPWCAS